MLPRPVSADEGFSAAAEAALAALAAEYPAYAQADVDKMVRLVGVLTGHMKTGADMAHDIEALHNLAHNAKGQGASFGYELITLIGEVLCEQLRDRAAIDGVELARAEALVNACQTVLTHRLTGWGGVEGARLMLELGIRPETP